MPNDHTIEEESIGNHQNSTRNKINILRKVPHHNRYYHHQQQQQQRAMAEDSAKRRIRENLVDGIGPFDVMADIIVTSQHAPVSSALFGIVQSPIKPPRPASRSLPPPSTSSAHAGPRLSAVQMAQRMQSIVDAPLSAIETNLPFKKNQERKNNTTNMPSTSSAGATNNCSGSSRSGENSGQKRKRMKSGSEETGAGNWQKPSTSSAAVPAKMETDGNKMTINELFGEEKQQGNGTEKRRPVGSSATDEAGPPEKKVKVEEKQDREKQDEEKEDKQSPDSGFFEITDNNRCAQWRPYRQRLQTIIGEVGQISPLLTPPRQPCNSDSHTLPVIMNLDRLSEAEQKRVRDVYFNAFLSAKMVPTSLLPPPLRPTSRRKRDTTLQPCNNTERSVLAAKPTPKTTNNENSSSSSGNTVAVAVANNKKQNTHSASATPSSSSAVKDHKKENNGIPRCGSASSSDRKVELAAVKNNDLKITFIKKFIKQREKTYVATSAPSSSATTTTTTTSTTTSSTSSSKENEKRCKKDDSSGSNEQLPSTSKQEKKFSQTKSSTPRSKSDEIPKEKEKKKRLVSEHSKEKEKSATSRVKDSGKSEEQPGAATATLQPRNSKKKQASGMVPNGTGSSSSSNNSNNNDSTDSKGTKSSKTKDDEVPPTKKFKKEGNTDKNPAADDVQCAGDSIICCRHRTAPTKKTPLDINDDGTYKSALYYQDEVARTLKHRADKDNTDRVRQTLAYMDAAVYFILSSGVPPCNDGKETQQRQYAVARESAELVKVIIRWTNTPMSSLERHFAGRFKLLSARLQAVLNYYLYSLKIANCIANFGALTKFESKLVALDAVAIRSDGAASASSRASSANTTTSSPASSISSGKGECKKEVSKDERKEEVQKGDCKKEIQKGECKEEIKENECEEIKEGECEKEINMPIAAYQAQRAQLSILHHLMWSDRLWKQSTMKIGPVEKEMVRQLDQICGPLTVDSNLKELSSYLATAVTWLRAEYRSEKERLS